MKHISLIGVLLGLSSLLIHAQIANNTSLVGTVTDPNGSVISGCGVSAVNANTTVTSKAVCNAQGYYAITFIQPGTYNITVTMNGFQAVTKLGVVVPVDQAVRTDFSLPVGFRPNGGHRDR